MAEDNEKAVCTPQPLQKPPKQVCVYRELIVREYLLVFDYQNIYTSTPHLVTVLPDGRIENEVDLPPEENKGLMICAQPQNMTKDIAQNFSKSPFVFERRDGSWAVVQAYQIDYDDKFRADYVCKTMAIEAKDSKDRFYPRPE